MMHAEISGAVAEINVEAIPHEDGIAYSFGFMQGLSGQKRDRPEDRHGLSKGYKAGYGHGKRVRNGGCPPPVWAKITRMP